MSHSYLTRLDGCSSFINMRVRPYVCSFFFFFNVVYVQCITSISKSSIPCESFVSIFNVPHE